ncbi:hypothetical protein [Pseudoflavonifractor sp.]|uniref:hypothetical protein n=1 Tax=Pseudoflavonifractor sp. TaxID=1980281 RepID=UPI003D8F5669
MKYFYGAGKRGPYFEGWQLRHQAPTGEVLSIFPVLRIDKAGNTSAVIRVESRDGIWNVSCPGGSLQASEGLFQIWVQGSLFNRKGVWLDLRTRDMTLCGELRYGPFTPLKSELMGPLGALTLLPVRRGVISMGHRLEGVLMLNGRRIDFTGGTGFIETVRGTALPAASLWSQSIWREERSNSLLVSVERLPTLAGPRVNCLCAVLYGGHEYRLASYRGAVVDRWTAEGTLIRQGPLRLSLEPAYPGNHVPVRYQLWEGERLLFDHLDPYAGYRCTLEDTPGGA